jgi:hypothetical protein
VRRGHTYPLFAGYPKVAVDAARLERARLREAEEQVLARRQVVAELADQTDKLEVQSAMWQQEKGRLMQVEEERRQRLRLEEDTLLVEKMKLDNAEKAERLRQVAVIESQYRSQMAKQRHTWQLELERLRDEVEHKQKRTAYEVHSGMEEQSIKVLEFSARQRCWEMEEEQQHEATMHRLRDEVLTRQRLEDNEVVKKQEGWRREDAEREVRRPWIAVAYSAPVFIIYPLGRGTFSDGMPLGISGTFNFVILFQAEHSILIRTFHR